MQKSEIALSIDGEKLDALEYYLKKENATVQKRMNAVSYTHLVFFCYKL